MIRISRQRTQRFMQARMLVLLAVLLLGSAPLLEASHKHSAADPSAGCMLCKKSSDTAVVAAVLPAPAATVQREPVAHASAAVPSSLSRTTQIRGPPVHT